MGKGFNGPRVHLARRLIKDGKTIIMCRCSDYVPIQGTVRAQEDAHREHRRAMGEQVADRPKQRDEVIKELRDELEVLRNCQTYHTSCTKCASNLALRNGHERDAAAAKERLKERDRVIREIKELVKVAKGIYDATPDWVRRLDGILQTLDKA